MEVMLQEEQQLLDRCEVSIDRALRLIVDNNPVSPVAQLKMDLASLGKRKTLSDWLGAQRSLLQALKALSPDAISVVAQAAPGLSPKVLVPALLDGALLAGALEEGVDELEMAEDVMDQGTSDQLLEHRHSLAKDLGDLLDALTEQTKRADAMVSRHGEPFTPLQRIAAGAADRACLLFEQISAMGGDQKRDRRGSNFTRSYTLHYAPQDKALGLTYRHVVEVGVKLSADASPLMLQRLSDALSNHVNQRWQAQQAAIKKRETELLSALRTGKTLLESVRTSLASTSLSEKERDTIIQGHIDLLQQTLQDGVTAQHKAVAKALDGIEDALQEVADAFLVRDKEAQEAAEAYQARVKSRKKSAFSHANIRAAVILICGTLAGGIGGGLSGASGGAALGALVAGVGAAPGAIAGGIIMATAGTISGLTAGIAAFIKNNVQTYLKTSQSELDRRKTVCKLLIDLNAATEQYNRIALANPVDTRTAGSKAARALTKYARQFDGTAKKLATAMEDHQGALAMLEQSATKLLDEVFSLMEPISTLSDQIEALQKASKDLAGSKKPEDIEEKKKLDKSLPKIEAKLTALTDTYTNLMEAIPADLGASKDSLGTTLLDTQRPVHEAVAAALLAWEKSEKAIFSSTTTKGIERALTFYHRAQPYVQTSAVCAKQAYKLCKTTGKLIGKLV